MESYVFKNTAMDIFIHSGNESSFNLFDSKDPFDIAIAEKIESVAAQYNDMIDNPSLVLSELVEDLRRLQIDHDDLEASVLKQSAALEAKERAALEACYRCRFQALYSKRYDIVNGIAGLEGAATFVSKNGETVNHTKGIVVPDFWLTAMKTNEKLNNEITERDEGALKYLMDIKCCKLKDPKGFKLEFIFSANPYFKNSILAKTYHMKDDSLLGKAIGTEIEWYPGNNLTHESLKMLRKEDITNIEKCESFFNFFNPPQIPEKEDTTDDAEEYLNLMKPDFDIGCTIRDKIIPHVVSWYTGEAVGKAFKSSYGFDVDMRHEIF